MNRIKFEKLSNESAQCALCEANFEIWMSNQRLNESREENIRSQFLKYCPACTKADSI